MHNLTETVYDFNIMPNSAEKVEILSIPALIGRGLWRLDRPHARPNHCIYWITRGQGRMSCDGITRGFSPHSLLFVPAGSVHAFLPGALVQGYRLSVTATSPVIAPDGPLILRSTSVFEQGEISGQLEKIMSEQQQTGPGAQIAMESYLALLSVWIARRQERNDWFPHASRPGAAERLLRQYLRWIEGHLLAKPTVSKAAAALSVTPTHLSRVCQARVGMPAAQIIRRRLIFAAMLALADSKLRINEIADLLGFATPAYFSRVFQSVCGQSPRGFRAANRRAG